jgi:hypothetical protein
MNVDRILEQLKAQRDHLDHAIDALSGATRNRPRGKRGRRKISAAGRKRISLAMKRRWREKRAQKSA